MGIFSKLFGKGGAPKAAVKMVNLSPLPGPLGPLMLAAREGQLAKVRSLIAAGHGVNDVYALGGTAAQMAAVNGHVDCLDVLIKAGADGNYVWKGVETGGMSSPTILMQAAFWGHAQCVKLLCAANVEIDATDDNGVTALIVAAKKGHLGCVRELINAGANLNLADKEGHRALSYSSNPDIKSSLNLAGAK